MNILVLMYSKPVAQFVLWGSVDGADHVSEVIHAQIHAGALTEQAVVQVFLIWLRHGRGVSDRLTVFTFSIAVPHLIQGLFASQKVIRLVLGHLSVADFHSDTVVLALSVSVTEQSDFTGRGDHTFHFDAYVMRAASLLLEMQLIVDQFVVISLWVCTHIVLNILI